MHSRIPFALLLGVMALALAACTRTPTSPVDDSGPSITLKWNKAYDAETQDDIVTGLTWVFINLGAQLPPGSIAQGVRWTTGDQLRVRFSGLGFSPAAMRAISAINARLQTSDEYRKTGAIDIGRWVMLTLNASRHYYAITGADTGYTAFRAHAVFDTMFAAILESTIAPNGRLIELPDPSEPDVMRQAFVVHEGAGTITSPAFAPREYEITRLMPNGQFRFAIYDSGGALAVSADTMLSGAGKPAKCLWCHEIQLQPTFIATTLPPAGFHSYVEFNAFVYARRTALGQYRSTLHTDIDYTRTQDHTWGELLYITFMEPTAQRLAHEWGMTEDAVKIRLSAYATHRSTEHPTLGDLYDRMQIDSLAPFLGERVPSSAREHSAYEPDFAGG